jgi:hypothetical protein
MWLWSFWVELRVDLGILPSNVDSYFYSKPRLAIIKGDSLLPAKTSH